MDDNFNIWNIWGSFSVVSCFCWLPWSLGFLSPGYFWLCTGYCIWKIIGIIWGLQWKCFASQKICICIYQAGPKRHYKSWTNLNWIFKGWDSWMNPGWVKLSFNCMWAVPLLVHLYPGCDSYWGPTLLWGGSPVRVPNLYGV